VGARVDLLGSNAVVIVCAAKFWREKLREEMTASKVKVLQRLQQPAKK